MTATIACTRAPIAELHERFQYVLPAVEAEGNTAFACMRSIEDREDAVAEAALTAWERFLRAVTESVSIDPADLARRAVASVVGRLHRQSLLVA